MNNCLSPRMSVIAELLGINNTVADIGCDHGILSAYLIKNSMAETVYATDISESSLNKAKRLKEDEQLDGLMLFCGDGFNAVPQKTDAAVIAGMGGEVIANMLSHPFAKTKLVLQPMKDAHILYKRLFETGFTVEKVKIAKEGGRFYEIILAHVGEDKIYDFNLPPMDRLEKDDNARNFLFHKIDVLEKAQKGVLKADTALGKERSLEILNKINAIKKEIYNAYGK